MFRHKPVPVLNGRLRHSARRTDQLFRQSPKPVCRRLIDGIYATAHNYLLVEWINGATGQTYTGS